MDFELGENWCAGRDAVSACDLFWELGPPPDMIVRIPPPPLPSLLESVFIYPDDSENTSCHWCDWAKSADSVDYVELHRQGPVMNDTWFFLLLASCILVVLLGLLFTFAYLRLKGKLLKGDLDFLGADTCKSGPENRTCETVLYPQSASSHSLFGGSRLRDTQGDDTAAFYETHRGSHLGVENTLTSSRALWAGVKTTNEGNYYTIAHAQPLEQKKSELFLHNNYNPIISPASASHDYAEYGSVGYTTLLSTAVTEPGKNSSNSFVKSGTQSGNTDTAGRNPNADAYVVGRIYANTHHEYPQQDHSRQAPFVTHVTNLDNDEETHFPDGSFVNSKNTLNPRKETLTKLKGQSSHPRRKTGDTPMVVSSPTLIASPNLPPLNQRRSQHASQQANVRKPADAQQFNNGRLSHSGTASNKASPNSSAVYSELSGESPEEPIYALPIEFPNKLQLFLHTPPVSPHKMLVE